MKNVAFYTLGCKLNFAETSTIAKLFINNGYVKVKFEDNPDIFVINTCSVTDNADKKCTKIVRSALKISPHAYIIITGCYAQLKPEKISNIPGVDAILGSKEKFKILKLIENFNKGNQPIIHVGKVNDINKFESAFSVDDRTRTFLKVQDGCDYFCAFCTIPLARGTSRSDSIDNVLKNIELINKKGIKEIVLTGVNLGDYGIINRKREYKFLDLVRAIKNMDLPIRFRISSIEPNLLEDEIIDIIANSNKFVPHLHIPLQSGNNDILKAMRRKYKRELYLEKVAKIKKLMPSACIGVDVIVGFPGESHEHFLDTYNFLNKLDCSYLHVFPYSERSNTRALNMHDVVPIEERIERAKMLRILSDKKKRFFYEQNLGSEREILFEHEDIDGHMLGFTENYIRIKHKYDLNLVNNLHKVKIDTIDEDGYAIL